MKARNSHDPKRRIAQYDAYDAQTREWLAQALIYVGSAHHKTRPGDYGFNPPVSPRPWKSICDRARVILLTEARELFRRGIVKGMFSPLSDGVPKYVWSVDADRALLRIEDWK
jgi:hypothetical protein